MKSKTLSLNYFSIGLGLSLAVLAAFQLSAFNGFSLGLLFSLAFVLCLAFLAMDMPDVSSESGFFMLGLALALLFSGQGILWLRLPREGECLPYGLGLMLGGSILLLWQLRPVPDKQPRTRRLAEKGGLELKWEMLLFGLAFGLGVFFRFWQLGQVPSNVWFDECLLGNTALDQASRPVSQSVFLGEMIQNPGMYFFLASLFFKLFGATVLSLRILAAVLGCLSLVPLYFLARLWFGPALALAGLWIGASQRWNFNFQRIGFMAPLASFWMLTSFLFLWRALRDRRLVDWILAGLCLGISMHTYLPIQLLLPVLGLFFSYGFVQGKQPHGGLLAAGMTSGLLLLLVLSVEKGLETHLAWLGWPSLAVLLGACTTATWAFRQRRSYSEGMIFLGFFLLVAFPLAWYASHDWAGFANRGHQVSIFRDVDKQGWGVLWTSFTRHLLMFNYQGDINGRHNLFGMPQLDTLSAGLFMPAVFLMHARFWKDSRAGFMLFWFWIMLFAAILTMVVEAPQAHRSVLLVPMIPLAILLLLEQGWNRVKSLFVDGLPRPLLAAGLVALLALPAFNYREYFVLWADDPATWRSFSPNATAVARRFQAQEEGWTLGYSQLKNEYGFNGYEMQEFCRFFLRQQSRMPFTLQASNPLSGDVARSGPRGVLCVWGDSDKDYTLAVQKEFPDIPLEAPKDPYTLKPIYLAMAVPRGRIPVMDSKQASEERPFLYIVK